MLEISPATISTSLASQVALSVREAIQTGDLVPGELYSVTRLAEQFHVSRTPVREAMLQLAEAGLVRFERNRGFRILRGSTREIAEVFELRLLLEVPAARFAATTDASDLLRLLLDQHHPMEQIARRDQGHRVNRTDQRSFLRHDEHFHDLILATTHNHRLRSTVTSLRTTTAPIGFSTAAEFRLVLEEHQPILNALQARDSDASALAMEYHVRTTAARLIEKLQNQTGDDAGREFGAWFL